MPLYETVCEKCARHEDIYRSIERRDETPVCCNMPMKRIISPPMVMPDIQPYRSMIDGSTIHSRSQHRIHLRDHGCIEVGTEQPRERKAPEKVNWKEELIRQFNK